jgi:hypothetical protein
VVEGDGVNIYFTSRAIGQDERVWGFALPDCETPQRQEVLEPGNVSDR